MHWQCRGCPQVQVSPLKSCKEAESGLNNVWEGINRSRWGIRPERGWNWWLWDSLFLISLPRPIQPTWLCTDLHQRYGSRTPEYNCQSFPQGKALNVPLTQGDLQPAKYPYKMQCKASLHGCAAICTRLGCWMSIFPTYWVPCTIHQ